MSAPNPTCEHCGGTGLVAAELLPPHPPIFRRCDCVLHRDILENAERALAGLSEAPVVKTSPLLGQEENDVRIVAGNEFLAHLRHVVIRKPPLWSAKVVSDAELVTAWLATVALKEEIRDADAHLISTRFLTIPDLVVPPDLVVIRMGIKVARNVASSEVLGEALNIRFHEGKATWIWEDPLNPLEAGHMFWSELLGRTLRRLPLVKDLPPPDRKKSTPSRRATEVQPPSEPSTRKTLRGKG